MIQMHNDIDKINISFGTKDLRIITDISPFIIKLTIGGKGIPDCNKNIDDILENKLIAPAFTP